MNRKFLRLFIIVSLIYIESLTGQDLQIQPNYDSDEWINRDESVTLTLSRPLTPEDGKLMIFIGVVDMTDLFVSMTDSVVYTPTYFFLPTGTSEIIVHLASPDNEWREITRFPIRVRTRIGLEKAEIDPQMTINNNGQLAEGHNPDTNTPPRETYQDFTGQANLSSEHARGTFALRSEWSFVGASEQNQALRFSEKDTAAAQIDIASYQLQLQLDKTELVAGHINHGRQKHLISGYGSRGLMLKTRVGSAFDISAAAMNGSNIVGWNNFLGLSRKQHRIYSGTLGFELYKSRPGTFRVESSLMHASLLPINNFNQGSITDAEESQGVGFRIQGAAVNQRVRFEGGFARSKFANPVDPLLSQGAQLVGVQETTNNARYGSLALGLLQNVSLSPTWQANVAVNVTHERVDPLYRSLGAYTQSDFLQDGLAVQSNIGPISMQYAHNRSEDNLDEIPSILKTKTRLNSVNVSIPLPYALSQPSGPQNWLPTINYGFNRVHQFGAGLPENGGFSESHVPDQVSKMHNYGLDWRRNRWQGGYRFAYSLQDNRQPGRETADFKNINNTITFALTPIDRFNFGVDLSFENALNKAQDRRDMTTRYGFNFSLRTTGTSMLNASVSTTNTEDNAKTSERNNTFINAQWSLSFSVNRSTNRQLLRGQLFIRYTRNEAMFKDTLFGFNSDTNNWTVNSGVNLSLF